MTHTASLPGPALQARAETLESRFALRIAARLDEQAAALAPDISERLRHAREQALARARAARPAAAPAMASSVLMGRSGSALLRGGSGGGRSGWWFKLAAGLPVVGLVAGLVLIQRWQDDAQISTAAEIDAALLSDDLPPAAYSDAGFVEFLKTPPHE